MLCGNDKKGKGLQLLTYWDSSAEASFHLMHQHTHRFIQSLMISVSAPWWSSAATRCLTTTTCILFEILLVSIKELHTCKHYISLLWLKNKKHLFMIQTHSLTLTLTCWKENFRIFQPGHHSHVFVLCGEVGTTVLQSSVCSMILHHTINVHSNVSAADRLTLILSVNRKHYGARSTGSRATSFFV